MLNSIGEEVGLESNKSKSGCERASEQASKPRATAWALLAVAGVVGALGACFEDAGERTAVEVERISARDQAYTSRGIERVIPLRFISVSWTDPPAFNETVDNALLSIDRANNALKASGVQLTLRSFEKFYMPQMATLGNVPGDPRLTWGAPDFVKKDFLGQSLATPIFSGIAINDGDATTVWDWLRFVTYKYASRDAVVVWLFNGTHNPAVGPSAGQPIDSSMVVMTNGFLGARSFLAHELGHYFGLPHTWEWGYQDPETGAPGTKADFWDLMYAPGTNAAAPHVYFGTRAAAAAASALEPIDRCGLGGGCVASCDVTTGTGGRLNCPDIRPVAGSGYFESKTHDSAELRRGLSLFGSAPDNPPTTYAYGANIMSYFSNGIDSANSVSSSQALQIRKALRFDQVHAWYGVSAQRPYLGQYVDRRPTDRLDFDNDGRRDLAVWRPPLAPATTGTFLIRFSAGGTSYSTSLSVPFGKLGDVPVPADYDGDGITDLALFRPGVSAAGVPGAGASGDQSSWWLCLSGGSPWSPATPATKCDAYVAVNFGIREDIPFPSLNFDGAGSTGELAVYRPSTKTWYWAIGQAWPSTPPWPHGSSAPWLGGVGVGDSNAGVYVPMPGLYDTDAKTDLVVYNPATATFSLRLSTTSWGTQLTRSFDASFIPSGAGTAAERAGAIPVPGMYSLQGGVHRLALALWDPATGAWSVNWRPDLYTNPQQPCVLGAPGDIPLGSIGTNFNQNSGSNYSSFAVFRSADLTADGKAYLITKAADGWECGGAVAARVQTGGGASFSRSRSQVFSVPGYATDGTANVMHVQGDVGKATSYRANCSPWQLPYTCSSVYTIGDPFAVFL